MSPEKLLPHIEVVQRAVGPMLTPATTCRFTACNVQIVNGLGATNGNRPNPFTTNPASTNVNGLVIGKKSITVQLIKLGKYMFDVIHRIGS